MPYKPNEREYRAAAPFILPDENENHDELVVRGTPIVFDTPTVLYEIDGIEYKEVIARGALDGCDMSDFIFNRNHGENDGTVYARTRNNSLTYNITSSGLDIAATLDKEDDRHRNLHRDIQKRRIDKMSFSFIVRESSYDRETHTRTITKIKKLYDVSAVDFPAYNETSITTARDFFSAEREKELKEQEQLRRRKMLIAQTYC
nr:MAG TPA: prohead serine protease [Caudoviricetes sp.]